MRQPFTRRGKRDSVDGDVDAEIAAHLEERVSRLIESGLTRDEAMAIALQRFGSVSATRRTMARSARRYAGRQRRRALWASIGEDARFAFRQWRRSPALMASIIVLLGLGIGGTATMFGVVDRLLFRAPPHVRDTGRVGRIYASRVEGKSRAMDVSEFSYARFARFRDLTRGSLDVAAAGRMRVIARLGSSTSRLLAGFVSGNLWTLLGVTPELGRFFTQQEDLPPDGSDVVVLSHEYWRAIGADRDVLGREIQIGDRRFTVIGVAPPAFTGIRAQRVDLWLPVTAVRARDARMRADWYQKNNLIWLSLVARLGRNATARGADTALTAAYRQIAADGKLSASEIEGRAFATFGPLLEERGPERSENTRIATWLSIVAAIVLLLACFNVANLLLARAIRRRREVGVRVALGVDRGRLLRQFMLEGLLLAAAGAVVGLAIATIVGRAVWTFLVPAAAVPDSMMDIRVFAWGLMASALAGLLASVAPAVYALRHDVVDLLKGGATDTTPQRAILRNALLLGQCALSAAMLLAAGLFVRSLQNARATPMGFDAQSLISARLDGGGNGASPLYSQMAERIRGISGVVSAATSTQIPFAVSGSVAIAVPGVDSAKLASLGGVRMNGVGDDYFATMGTRILRGRGLTKDDRRGSQLVMVVSDSLARALWPSTDPIGRCVRIGGDDQPCYSVVGVAENTHQYEVRSEGMLQYWYPASQSRDTTQSAYGLMIRVEGDARQLVETLRKALQPMAPTGTYVNVSAVSAAVDRVIFPWRAAATVLGAFSALGLLVAAMGIYSVLAYAVNQRTKELGLRLALGATPASLLQRVVVDGIRLVTLGIGIGLGVAYLARHSLEASLFGVGALDPASIAVSVVVLVGAAITASAIPGWRASRVDPSISLRAD